MRPTLPSVIVLSGSAFVVSCTDVAPEEIETRSSALSSAHTIVVPAYFAQDNTANADNSAIAEVPDDVAWVVMNAGRDWGANEFDHPANMNGLVLGGPGANGVSRNANGVQDPIGGKSTYVQNRINELHAAGISVLGYVSLFYRRPTAQINDDIDHWRDYGANGIFFDEAPRADDSGIQRFRYFLSRVLDNNNFWFGYAMFNWGGISTAAEGYVYCVVQDAHMRGLFVTAETSQGGYTTGSYATAYGSPLITDWLYRYNPFHFVHIIHHASDQSTTALASFMQTSAQRNARHVYVTDLPNPMDTADPANPYKYLDAHWHTGASQFDSFWRQVGQVQLTQTTFPGPATDAPRGFAPGCGPPVPSSEE